MYFYFIRHGKSEANKAAAIAGANSPLAEEGIQQAKTAAQELAGLGIEVLVSSPYLRAKQTAQIIAPKQGIAVSDIKIIDDLRERGFGELEDKPKMHESAWYFSTPSGFNMESHEALIRRTERTLETLKEFSKSGLVLVVGHAVSGFFLQQVAGGKTKFEDFDPISELHNAEYTKIEVVRP